MTDVLLYSKDFEATSEPHSGIPMPECLARLSLVIVFGSSRRERPSTANRHQPPTSWPFGKSPKSSTIPTTIQTFPPENSHTESLPVTLTQ